jgi:DnaJ-class molecular chaperone
MVNHYKTLGLTNAATQAEVRRAYRILARRYHPDVNPGKSSEERFKEISKAYTILSDPEKRAQHDLDLDRASESFSQTFDRAHAALKKNQQRAAYSRVQQNTAPPKRDASPPKAQPKRAEPAPAKIRAKTHTTLKRISDIASSSLSKVSRVTSRLRTKRKRPSETETGTISQVALIETSISLANAIQGTRHTVEIPESEGASRKISVRIPAGVRTGSVIRFRNKQNSREEIVVVVHVERHPWLSISERGLTMEIPLSISEAVEGGKIQVPSLGEPLLVKVEPRTQSGREVRLKNQGLKLRDGSRGDLFIRFIVKVPESSDTEALTSKSRALDPFYPTSVRQHLPKSILEE